MRVYMEYVSNPDAEQSQTHDVAERSHLVPITTSAPLRVQPHRNPMDSDTSDILGGPTFPNARDSQFGWWSSLPFGAKLVFVLIVSFILNVVFVHIRRIFLAWREKAYKLWLYFFCLVDSVSEIILY